MFSLALLPADWKTYLRVFHPDQDQVVFLAGPVSSALLIFKDLVHLLLQSDSPNDMRRMTCNAVYTDQGLDEKGVIVRLSFL
jgi:hypothetical protein